MVDRLGRERLLELQLAGTPDRALASLAAASPEDTADLAALREDLGLLAHAAPPVEPPKRLRERLLATRPRARGPRRPVLVVLDMINDYLTPGRPLEVPRARDVVPAVKERITWAHEKNVPVIYVCDAHEPNDEDFREWPRHAVAGTEGGDVWPEIAPSLGDHLVHKRTYSAFTGSSFGPLLDELHADQIILTGCATEIGMFATAKDALERGFVVTIPPDCQAGMSVVAEQVTLVTLAALVPFEPRYLRAAP
ncbi:isochorismatase family protein [Polyangium sp. 6x1]|uniref:cysteine hydrolase family protein n=1 Tax=Polyangium sp. 6x1 TaxID=3042689 RepID=UPI002482E7F3|nr:isochorismatase family protein [Polyangium sp. 6x1]MDI1446559.1 isochorismatase family protein [Polyangium sp. 6x1]